MCSIKEAVIKNFQKFTGKQHVGVLVGKYIFFYSALRKADSGLSLSIFLKFKSEFCQIPIHYLH